MADTSSLGAAAGQTIGRRRSLRMAPAFKRDLLRTCLYLLIVVTVSRVHGRFPMIADMRPGLVLVGLALFAAFLNPRALADSRWYGRWPAKVVLGLLVTALISVVFGISQGGSLFFFRENYSKTLVVTFLLMASIRELQDLWRYVWAYVVACAVIVWMALFIFQLQPGITEGFERLSKLETYDANDVCVVLLIGLAYCLLLIKMSSTPGKIVAGVVAVGICVVIARSGSRGGFLGFGVSLLAYLLSMKGARVWKRLAFVVLLATGLVVAAPAGYWRQMNTITSVTEDYNYRATQGRRQLALRGLGYMLQYPVGGLGVGNFPRAEGTISSVAGQVGIRWSAPHNSYVEAGAEMGLPGLILFGALVVGCIVSPWRLRRRIPVSWQAGSREERFLYQAALYFPLAAIGFAVPAFFVSFAYADPIYILAALTCGLLYCVDRRLGGYGSAAVSLPRERPGRLGGIRHSGVAQRAGQPRRSIPVPRFPTGGNGPAPDSA